MVHQATVRNYLDSYLLNIASPEKIGILDTRFHYFRHIKIGKHKTNFRKKKTNQGTFDNKP